MTFSLLTRATAAPALAAFLFLPGALAAQSLPEGVSEADVESFRAAVVAAGCEIREDAQATSVEEATGFDEDKLGALVEYMVATGEMIYTPGMPGLGMENDQCPGSGDGGEDDDDDDDDNG